MRAPTTPTTPTTSPNGAREHALGLLAFAARQLRLGTAAWVRGDTRAAALVVMHHRLEGARMGRDRPSGRNPRLAKVAAEALEIVGASRRIAEHARTTPVDVRREGSRQVVGLGHDAIAALVAATRATRGADAPDGDDRLERAHRRLYALERTVRRAPARVRRHPGNRLVAADLVQVVAHAAAIVELMAGPPSSSRRSP